MISKSNLFNRFAKKVAYITGTPATFLTALAVIIAWGATGPIFHYNDTWQLAINTSTTIITFLMVFVIQNAQNRDSKAMQLKLDELIRAQRSAHNSLIDLEELEEEELETVRQQFIKIAKEARENLRHHDARFATFAKRPDGKIN